MRRYSRMMAAEQIIDLRQRPPLYLIGGTPRAGKSILAKRLWQHHGIVGYSLDATVAGLMQAVPEAEISWTLSDKRDEVIAAMARPVAEMGLRKHGTYLLEGESLTPFVASSLAQHYDIRPVFLVLHSPDLAAVEQNEQDHAWVHRLDAAEKEQLLFNLRKRSEMFQDEADRFGFPCIDMSIGSYADRVREAEDKLSLRNAFEGT